MADYVYPQGVSPMSNTDVANLRNTAESQYPFLKNNIYNMTYTGPKNRDGAYLEAWQQGDEGAPDWKRDANLPINTVGIEIMRPDVTSDDIAADMLSHIDKVGQTYNNQLARSLLPQQIEQLKKDAADYRMSLLHGATEEQSLKNASSSLFRAAVFGQWGPNGTANMHFNPSQQSIIDKAKWYAHTGKSQDDGMFTLRDAINALTQR